MKKKKFITTKNTQHKTMQHRLDLRLAASKCLAPRQALAMTLLISLTVLLVFGWAKVAQSQPMTAKAVANAGLNQNKQHNPPSEAKSQIIKRSFVGLGCLGVYDKAKFARLDKICEDCYQLYREPDIHAACR